MKILNILFFRELVVPSPYPHIIIFFYWKLLLHLLFCIIQDSGGTNKPANTLSPRKSILFSCASGVSRCPKKPK